MSTRAIADGRNGLLHPIVPGCDGKNNSACVDGSSDARCSVPAETAGEEIAERSAHGYLWRLLEHHLCGVLPDDADGDASIIWLRYNATPIDIIDTKNQLPLQFIFPERTGRLLHFHPFQQPLS